MFILSQFYFVGNGDNNLHIPHFLEQGTNQFVHNFVDKFREGLIQWASLCSTGMSWIVWKTWVSLMDLE